MKKVIMILAITLILISGTAFATNIMFFGEFTSGTNRGFRVQGVFSVDEPLEDGLAVLLEYGGSQFITGTFRKFGRSWYLWENFGVINSVRYSKYLRENYAPVKRIPPNPVYALFWTPRVLDSHVFKLRGQSAGPVSILTW